MERKLKEAECKIEILEYKNYRLQKIIDNLLNEIAELKAGVSGKNKKYQ